MVTSPALPGLQGVLTMFVNDQPGSLTLHFDSLRSDAHVQAIPEPDRWPDAVILQS